MNTSKFFVGTQEVSGNNVEIVSEFTWSVYGVAGVPFPAKKGKVAFVYQGPNGEKQVARLIDYNQNGSKHVCDSRCLNAKGGNCECSCGGANHGAGHH